MARVRRPYPRQFEVVVGNVGVVYQGPSGIIALTRYENCRQRSIEGLGLMAGEPVTLFADGEPVRLHQGSVEENAEEACQPS